MASLVTDIAGRVVSTISAVGSFYTEINPSTLSGAIDVVVVEHNDGELHCSPFHVRFGKLQLLRPSEKVVEVAVNGVVTDLAMKVGEAGEAFFIVEADNPVPSEYATSPIAAPSSPPQEPFVPFALDDVRPSSPSPQSPSTVLVNHVPSQLDATTDAVASLSIVHETNSDHVIIHADTAHRNLPSHAHAPSDPVIKHLPSMPPIIESSITPFTVTPSLDVPSRPIPYSSSDHGTPDQPPISRSPQTESEYEPNHRVDRAHMLSISPSQNYSWGWGRLPERQNRDDITSQLQVPSTTVVDVNVGQIDKSVDSVKQDQVVTDQVGLTTVTPVLKSQYTGTIPHSMQPSNPIPSMSVAEKVDHYLSTLQYTTHSNVGPIPSIPNDTKGIDDPFLDMITSLLDPSTTNTDMTDRGFPKLELSLCGHLIKTMRNATSHDLEMVFKSHIVTFDQVCDVPWIVYDPMLVVCVGEWYVSWSWFMPVCVGWMVYRKVLGRDSMRRLFQRVGTVGGGVAVGVTTTGAGMPDTVGGSQTQPDTRRYSFGHNLRSWWGRGTTSSSTQVSTSSSPPPQQQQPSQQEKKEVKPTASVTNAGVSSPQQHQQQPSTKHRYAKSLRLTSDQLKSLHLQKGINTITFSVTTKLQGRATCMANLFLWHQDDKVVISDVDGTITKSDVLGHMFTMVGRDWTHAGVASLYTNIHRNGYKFLYLTSRAIGQAKYTRDYLQKVEQDRYQLPSGPVIMSPDRLLRAFHREVILRKPEEFKISCLRDIKKLFGDRSPFYGGFGNRITDALSYRSVDVPRSRIFTVDPSGEVKLELMEMYRSTYMKLNDVVDQMFPPIEKGLVSEYMDLCFWKQGLPDIETGVDGQLDMNRLIMDHEKEGGDKEKGVEEEEGSVSDVYEEAEITPTSYTKTSGVDTMSPGTFGDGELEEQENERLMDIEEAPFM